MGALQVILPVLDAALQMDSKPFAGETKNGRNSAGQKNKHHSEKKKKSIYNQKYITKELQKKLYIYTKEHLEKN